MSIKDTVIVLGVTILLGTCEFLLLDGWQDFQRLRHGHYISLPDGFDRCLDIATVKEWSSETLSEPLQTIVIHPCINVVHRK